MKDNALDKLYQRLESYIEEVIHLQEKMIPLKPLSPENGGDGELEKAKFLEKILEPLIDKLDYYNASDDRVSSGIRPNLFALKKGKNSKKRLLIISHMDVVPSGDEKSWNTDPWEATIKDGKIYGRGSEDNNQAIVSSVCLLKALNDEKIIPPIDIVLLLVSDEECGNTYGVEHLVKNHRDMFRSNDLAIAMDAGTVRGDTISIAEKGSIWLKITVKGKQTHGAYPNRGINAHYAGSEFAMKIEELYSKYNESDELFDLPYNTFEATKRELNVDNINTVPGSDVLFFDIRYLPSTSKNEILSNIERIKNEIEVKRGVKITCDYVKITDPNKTSEKALITKTVSKAAKLIYGVDPHVIGIGGNSIAAGLRGIGIDVVLYSKLNSTLHEPNEYSIIDNTLNDAKILMHVLWDI